MRKNSWYLKLFGISMLNFFNRMKKMKVYRRYHFTFSKEDDEKERWRIGAKLNKINYHSVILKILRSLEELFSSFEGKGNRSSLSLSFSRPSFSTAKTRIYISKNDAYHWPRIRFNFLLHKTRKSDMELIPFRTTSQKCRVTSLYHRLHPINRFYFN